MPSTKGRAVYHTDPDSKTPGQQFSVVLAARQVYPLHARAEAEGISAAQVIRKALDAYLSKPLDTTTKV